MGLAPPSRSAEVIAAARRAGVKLARLDDAIRPATIDDGYRVQDEVHRLLTGAGWGPVAGHKIGATTPVMQQYLMVEHPCAGGIFASTVHRSGATVPHGRFRRVGVECEVAVRLGRDLGPAGAPHDRTSVARAVDSYMPAIELVDDRYIQWQTAGTPTLIGDDFFGAGSVLGDPVATARAPDLETAPGRAMLNGAEAARGVGADVMGHPLEALAWLANSFASRGRTLRAGEFVSTGSLVKTLWLEPGDHVAIEIGGLGRVDVTFSRE